MSTSGTEESVSLRCYNVACGKTYSESENNDDSCIYHSGHPVFHDAFKSWSCCSKKTTDFTEFLNIPGCSRGKHSNVKPEPLVKQSKKSNEDMEKGIGEITNKPINLNDPVERPSAGSSLVNLSSKITNIDEIRRLAVNLGHRRNKAQDCDIICKFFKFLLELWGTKLSEREEVEKTSTAGKIESQTYTQTQAYLKPLFKQLKRIKIADDILKHLTLIVKYTLDRDYVQANEAYLRMAIGNAPWPIGVTMVGIHARTGREKIFSQNIAHVMNDETQRKYIQGLKRLITKCQQYFPTDPSRCVEYKALG